MKALCHYIPALAIREAVTLVRALLRDKKVDYQGRTVGFKGGGLKFPLLRPDLPIYIGSNSPMGLRLARELADGTIVSSCAPRLLWTIPWALSARALPRPGETSSISTELHTSIAVSLPKLKKRWKA